MTDADPSKALVMEALRCLVDDELADWHRTKNGDLELRLVTGETFVVGDSGITSKRRSLHIAPMPSTKWRGQSPFFGCSDCTSQRNRPPKMGSDPWA